MGLYSSRKHSSPLLTLNLPAGWDARASKLVARPHNAPKLIALPAARLIIENPSAARSGVVKEHGVVFKAPLYVSTTARSGAAILEIHLLTDLPQQVLVLSSCAVYCIDDTSV